MKNKIKGMLEARMHEFSFILESVLDAARKIDYKAVFKRNPSLKKHVKKQLEDIDEENK